MTEVGGDRKEKTMNKKIAIVMAAFAVLGSVNPTAAQNTREVRKIGFLSTFSQTHAGSQSWHKAFEQGLRKYGWVVGKNITIDHRWIRDRRECRISGRRACLPALVDELLGLKVELIVVHGGLPARAIQRKSRTIPVVMAEASDAVGRGIVKSLARPGGNITGLTSITPKLGVKRLEILKEIVAGLTNVAVLWTTEAPASEHDWQQMQAPARRLGLRLHPVQLRRGDDVGKAFQGVARSGAGALISTSGVFSTFDQKKIMALVMKSRLPAIFTNRDRVAAGGLMSYNRDTADLYRQAAGYVDKILKGARPANLPVEQPTKFDLVVNLKTAKALGTTIPRSILLRATEVIE